MRKDETALRKDHEAVRKGVGYYDFTHKLLEVNGKDANKFLDMMFVAGINKMEIGTAKYTTMLNEDGIIIDDVIVFRIKKHTFWISTLYIDELIAWFDRYKKAKEIVSYREITGLTTMYAVQGPKSRKVLNKMLKKNIDALKYFAIEPNEVNGVKVSIARSGFTGELGYEIYCSPKDSAYIEKCLKDAGSKYGIRQITTDVIITSLPAEKGFVLMSDLAGTNPLEVGFGWTIDWKSDFIGKKALLKVRNQGARRSLLGFTVDDDAAEIDPGAEVMISVGKATKFTYGYSVKKNIGYALVDKAAVKPGDKVTINSNGKSYEATVSQRCFYDLNSERTRG